MLTKLIAIQRREKLSDLAMSSRLGISRSAWSLIRRDKLDLSHRVAVLAVGAWPELTRELLDRAAGVNEVADTETSGDEVGRVA